VKAPEANGTRPLNSGGGPGAGSRLGELLVREGLITLEQLAEALQVQGLLPAHTALGQILLDQRVITPKQLNFVIDKYRKRPRLGDVLVRARLITEDQLKAALEQQRRLGLRLGDALVQLNLVSEIEMRRALSTQLNVAFVDLDALPVGPPLASLIKKSYAYKHRVVPVVKLVDGVVVCMDDPTDRAVLKELEAFAGGPVTVVTSTRASLRNALVRIYEPDAAQATARTSAPDPWG
jgi:hypothetical protein